MKSLSSLILAIAIFSSCEQTMENEVTSNNQEHRLTINIGTKDSLFSETLDEQRKIWLYVPDSEENGVFANKKYPVLYLLDGDAHFTSVVGMIQQLSMVNGNSLCPEMIVVGILNTDRTRDLTPTHVENASQTRFPTESSGGGEKFTQFIEKELIPFVDNKYPTTAHRTLVGHSLGGLFAINTLIKHPHLFSNYIAIDPSLWWDKQKLSLEAEKLFDEQKFDNNSLYVAVANTMREGMRLAELATDTTEQTEHIRSILRFSKSTAQKKESGLNFKWKYYDEDDHGSVPLIATYDALRFLYSWYNLRGIDEYVNPQSRASKEQVLSIVNDHYKTVSEKLGYDVLPPEDLVNSMGYAFMGNGMNEKAYAFFQMNIENYPESANVYDSMGDYFVSQSNTEEAIKHFRKAVEIGGIPVSKEKLENLMKEKIK